ncbi:serine/threonine-protein kinase polo-like [Musca vetustissima]|uniref:serine/threonine-protein kinase polo-like n=1 Tax=Musca vetustissima TaxID=27455 RepID=UPI002AB7B5E1|nr:serine/threonine-protein kinase polo-like [Musca vetustissima]
MAAKVDDESSDIPERLYDSTNNKTYKRMRFFGKVGLGALFIKLDPFGPLVAGKIVSKKFIMKHNLKDQMTQEITIHRSLNHANIVKFHWFFQDSFNIYIVLDLCKERSMWELLKHRKTITDYECRYYIYQIIQGVKYLHDNRIIHRDLKLNNIFLNDMLQVKIGDFGLATRIEYEGERKSTLCGTPDFLAPEILTKKGYSYEVDIWAIGCVMYTLLVGQPPFETKTLKDTYSKIKKCDYRVPSYLRKSAADMVISMLQSNPENRPKIGDLLHFEFLSSSPVPMFLPSFCLTMAPRLELNETIDHENAQRKQLTEELKSSVTTTIYYNELSFLTRHGKIRKKEYNSFLQEQSSSSLEDTWDASPLIETNVSSSTSAASPPPCKMAKLENSSSSLRGQYTDELSKAEELESESAEGDDNYVPTTCNVFEQSSSSLEDTWDSSQPIETTVSSTSAASPPPLENSSSSCSNSEDALFIAAVNALYNLTTDDNKNEIILDQLVERIALAFLEAKKKQRLLEENSDNFPEFTFSSSLNSIYGN